MDSKLKNCIKTKTIHFSLTQRSFNMHDPI